MAVNFLEISYPNFTLGAIIDPEEANQNNYEIVGKLNESIELGNINSDKVEDLYDKKSDVIYVDGEIVSVKSLISNLSGIGRTTETVRQNFINMSNHKLSNDHDIKYYTKKIVDDKFTIVNNTMNDHKQGKDHDKRYYTKAELTPWLRGGDTLRREDVFEVNNPNNGDGTFSYRSNGETVIGELTEEGYQVFQLVSGRYDLGLNRIEVYINDTLRRSAASGGLIELEEDSFILTSPEDAGAEITAVYYERLGFTAEYNIKLSNNKPPQNDGKTMWFEVI